MGKTAQLIALFLASPAPPGQPRNLVITPGHLCNQWSNEIQKFAPSLRVAVAADPSALGPNPRRVLEPACQANDVVITSLEVVLQIVQIREVLFGLSWRRIVYDECHEVIANTSLEQQGMLEQLARRALREARVRGEDCRAVSWSARAQDYTYPATSLASSRLPAPPKLKMRNPQFARFLIGQLCDLGLRWRGCCRL